MLRSLVSLFLLLYLRHGRCAEEDNLEDALNAIENRQRQLASGYYGVPTKNSDRKGFQVDDDALVYLGDISPSDTSRRKHFSNGKSRILAHSYEDDYNPAIENEDYQKAIDDRLLDQLILDMLNSETELPEQRAQKKSFFREREINEVSDNLQDLQPELDVDENPSARYRSKSHLAPRRISQPYELEDEDGGYLNAVDPLWKKYNGQTLRNRDPETFDRDELDAFFKYLAKDRRTYDEEDEENSDDYTRETYVSENRNRDRDRSKRYWLGSHRPSQIRKRSASVEEKPNLSNRTSNSSSVPPVAVSAHSTTVTKLKRDKKGQAEIPSINVNSLKPLNIKKKSIDWSNYFGVDKRQKKSNKAPTKEPAKSDVLLDQYIQSYILQSVRDSAFNNRGNEYGRYPKRTSYFGEYENSNGKSETADDLRNAEDMIIDNVLKYTGAHQGATDPQALRRYRERVIDELGAAYSLEKLRQQIAPLSQSRMKRQHQHKDDKRVAVKKESAEPLPPKASDIQKSGYNNTNTGLRNFLESHYFLNPTCASIAEIIDICSTVSELEAGDHDHVFVPVCALYSLCNVCGETKDFAALQRKTCTVDYYERVGKICSLYAVPHCFAKARSIIKVLQRREEETSNFAMCEPCINDIFSQSDILQVYQ